MATSGITEGHARRLRYAGYTHYIQYELWLPMLGVWTVTGYPLTGGEVAANVEAVAKRIIAGEIREAKIIDLQDY